MPDLIPPRDLVLHSRHVVTPQGVIEAAVHVREGRILEVVPGPGQAALPAPEAGPAPRIAPSPADGPTITIELAPTEWLLPGLVDTHVHINEPGRTEWEGFRTA